MSSAQLVAIQLLQLTQTCEQEEKARLVKEVWENSVARLAAAARLALPTLKPSFAKLGAEVNGSTPINTHIHQIRPPSSGDNIHLLYIFGGTGLGALRVALATGHTIRYYTYVDRDGINRRIAREVFHRLQQQYLD